MKTRHFLGDRSGVAMIEFIIILPVFLFLLLGVIEVGRLILAHQKVSRAAFAIASMASSADAADIRQRISDSYAARERMMSPFSVSDDNPTVIVSAFNRVGTGSTSRIWECKSSASATSKVSDLTGILSLDSNEGVYIVEFNMNYETILGDNFYTSYLTQNNSSTQQVYSRYIIKPRDGGIISNITCP